MAVPKKRTPKSKRNSRRSHHFLKAVHFSACPRCKNPVPSHTACPNCGYYKDRAVIDIGKKLARQEKRAKEKQAQT